MSWYNPFSKGANVKKESKKKTPETEPPAPESKPEKTKYGKLYAARAGEDRAITLVVAVLHLANGERRVAAWSADGADVVEFVKAASPELELVESLQVYDVTVADKVTWTAR